jgi:Leucine-rich repeat (LRR) protein
VSTVYTTLDFNRIEGSIPTTIGMLTRLEVLRLGVNKLIPGEIPTQIGDLKSLQELSLQKSSLQGSIPSEIGLLSDLEILSLGTSSFNYHSTDHLVCALADDRAMFPLVCFV